MTGRSASRRTRTERFARVCPAVLLCLLLLAAAGCRAGGQTDSTDSAKRPFDYYVDCTTREQAEMLEQLPFVESVFPFSLLIFKREGYGDGSQGALAVCAAPSFEDLENTPFSPDRLVKRDDAIMNDPAKNPILIDQSLARAEHLSVGDTLSQPTSLRGEPLVFTIAGIFPDVELFDRFDSVALLNDQLLEVLGEKVEEFGYTNLYLKASDPAALTAYMETEFVPGLQVKGLSEEEVRAFREMGVEAYYEEYGEHMKRMK